MARRRRYTALIILYTNYADDILLLANTPTQAESLLHSLGETADGICCHVVADKTSTGFFNQKGDISSLNSGSMKQADKFTYLRSSVSSTENYITI